MTYEKIVEKVKKAYPSIAEGIIDGHKAIQLNVYGEGEGALYVEVNGTQTSVEPYEYYDNDAIVSIGSDLLISVLDGKAEPGAAYTEGSFTISGDVDSALKILSARKVAKAKKAAESAKKTAKKVAEEAKPVVEKAVKATKEVAVEAAMATAVAAMETAKATKTAAKKVGKATKAKAEELKPVVEEATKTVKKTAKKVADETMDAAKSGAKAAAAGVKAAKESLKADKEAKSMPTGTATEVTPEEAPKTEE